MKEHLYEAIVIGGSAGGNDALEKLLSALPKHFPLPIICVQHINSAGEHLLVTGLSNYSNLTIKFAEDDEIIKTGTVYLAPPNYHLLVDFNKHLSLSADPYVNNARPSIDMLFESASDVFGTKLIGIILSGAGFDGSKGLSYIKNHGGLTIIQDPQTAYMPHMPINALKLKTPDYLLGLTEIPDLINSFCCHDFNEKLGSHNEH